MVGALYRSVSDAQLGFSRAIDGCGSGIVPVPTDYERLRRGFLPSKIVAALAALMRSRNFDPVDCAQSGLRPGVPKRAIGFSFNSALEVAGMPRRACLGRRR